MLLLYPMACMICCIGLPLVHIMTYALKSYWNRKVKNIVLCPLIFNLLLLRKVLHLLCQAHGKQRYHPFQGRNSNDISAAAGMESAFHLEKRLMPHKFILLGSVWSGQARLWFERTKEDPMVSWTLLLMLLILLAQRQWALHHIGCRRLVLTNNLQ